MKNNTMLNSLKGLCLLLIAAFAFSCTENEDIQEPIESFADEASATNCNPPNPSLGPNAPQYCYFSGTAYNKGTLDCRTNNGGYSQSFPWGIYKIEGGTQRYTTTKTRVERFFRSIGRSSGDKTVLTGRLKIMGLSDGNTCIIQSHATGKIVKGVEAGKTIKSAQFLLYARKSGSQAVLDLHITDNPYTTTTGGHRNEILNWKTLNYGQEYTFRYETGYTTGSSPTQFSYIKVGGTERYILHNHTTERVYSRYGAYGTSDSGDKTAEIRFKDIGYCEYK